MVPIYGLGLKASKKSVEISFVHYCVILLALKFLAIYVFMGQLSLGSMG